jgi:nucleoside-diphosphate-sugar epimerase
LAGGDGFIGSQVRIALEKEDRDITFHLLSRDGELDNSRIPVDSKVIINCAGRLGGQGRSRSEMEKANTRLPILLAEWAKEHGAYLIHLSTPGVAGLIPGSREDSPLAPWGDYEGTKAEAEVALNDIMRREMMTILRPDFVYGPGDRHKLTMFRQIAKGWFPLIGMGKARIRPTYVADVVEAVMASMPGGPLEGGLFNIGGPEVVSVRKLLGKTAEIMDMRLSMIPVPRILCELMLRSGPLRPSALSRSRLMLFGKSHYVSIKKAKDSGFEPAYGLERGLCSTIDWYRSESLL